MTDFETMKKICERNFRLSETVIDNYLLYYAGENDNLAREFDQRIGVYKHVTRDLEPSMIARLKSQYIVHRVLKKNGLLRKYLNHAEIKRLPPEELEYLSGMLDRPWRFSYSIIVDKPAADFYQMEDVFTGEPFLIYSRSTTKTLEQYTPMLWFNLISFNGACWQTFGPVSFFLSFDADDIFFFATERNPRVEDGDTLLEDVEKNPVPYMLLLLGAGHPITVDKQDEIVMLLSQCDVKTLDPESLRNDFSIASQSGVYRITLKKWDEPPHLAAAYLDQEENLLTVSAMTDRGFAALVEKLNEHGSKIPADADLRVHPTMIITAEDILKKKIELNPYEGLFPPESTPESKGAVEKMNVFLQSVLPDINAGRIPDIESLAKAAGIDVSLAEQLVANTMERINAMRRGK